MPGYAHAYDVTACPRCGHDLTRESGVTIESYREGVGRGFVPSRLDADGRLEDAFCILECGLHGDTLCGGCGESLSDHERL